MTTDTTDRLPSQPDVHDRRAPIDHELTTSTLSGAANIVGRTAGAWAAQLISTVRTLPHRYRILAGATLVGVTLAIVTATAIRGGTRASSSNGPSS